MSFLSVPLKRTNEVNLYEPLKAFIDSMQLSPELAAEFNEALQELNKLRNKACIDNLDRNDKSLLLLERYYDQLKAIENKLPITPSVNPVTFKWKDAFDKGALFFSRASLTLSEASFERACVLFNCAAMMSAVAAAQGTTNDEELKTAAVLFQRSAGVFTYLKENIMSLIHQEPTPDLMPDTLAALAALMLAQAQECVYLKASNARMKPTSLVKVANQAAQLYKEAHTLMTRDVVRGIFDKDWLHAVVGKSKGLEAAANIHAASLCEDESKIGEQICRLMEGVRLAEQMKSNLPTASYPVLSTASQNLASAQKDNDFIYHERVPDSKTLEALGKVMLVKATPVEIYLSPMFKDLFESLVPVAIQNALSAFETRKTEVVNIETGRLKEYTQLMNEQLTSMNLPAALDDVLHHEKCPESIRQKSSKIKQSGGITSIVEKMEFLPSLYAANEQILIDSEKILQDEKSVDDNMRNQFKGKWTRVASDTLTVPLHQEIGKYRSLLRTATAADGLVRTKFEANKQGIELLSKPENELKEAIPGLGSAGGTQNKAVVTELRELINRTNDIKVAREKLEKDFKAVRFDMSGEFLQSMAGSDVVNEEAVSNSKIQELLGPLKDQVGKSIEEQEQLFAKIMDLNQKFVSERVGAGGDARENVLKSLATAYDAYFELEGNLKEGVKFYNDLQGILNRLQQKISDFASARKIEKEDLLKEVQMNIVSTPSNVPPPRPPPPSTTATAPPPNNNAQQYQQTPQPPPRTFGAPPPQQPVTYPDGGYQPSGYPQPAQPYPVPGYQPVPQQQPYNPYGTAPNPNQYQVPQHPYGGYQPQQPYAGYQQNQQVPYGYGPPPPAPQHQHQHYGQQPPPPPPNLPYPQGYAQHPQPKDNTNPFM